MLTYGWAILIIVIVAAALWSFGVFNPSSSRSQAVTGFAGLGSVQGACFSNGTLLISIGDSTGLTINVTAINATSSLFSGQKVIRPNKTVSPSASSIFGINSTCPSSVGSSFSVSMTVTYKQIGTALPGLQFSSGTVSGTVASPPPPPTTFTETGLPIGTNWNVTYQSIIKSSTTNTIAFRTSGSGAFSIPSNGRTISGIYTLSNVPNATSGTVSSGVTVPVSFTSKAINATKVFIGNNSQVPFFLFAINTSNNQLSATKSIQGTAGGYVRGMAVSPDGQKLYVTGYIQNKIYIFNTTNFRSIANISDDTASEYGLALTPDGKTLYSTDYGSPYQVRIYNVSSPSYPLIKTLNFGMSLLGVTVTPNGKLAYVSVAASHIVSVINTTTNVEITNITTGARPHDPAATPDSKLVYVPDFSSHSVAVINTTSQLLKANITTGGNPTAAAVTPNGRFVYVTLWNGASGVTIINVSNNQVWKNITDATNFNNLAGLAIRPDGTDVYVDSFSNGKVAVISTSTNTVVATVAIPYPLVACIGQSGTSID